MAHVAADRDAVRSKAEGHRELQASLDELKRCLNELSGQLADDRSDRRRTTLEDATALVEVGGLLEVDRRANRVEIRRAIEKIFNVRVANVRTMQVKGKIKQRGRIVGKHRDWKKAIVNLMPGERIDFFEGV